MTLVQLRHFVVLVDKGSFVQASAALFITQPALTRSIRGLEDELGGALFDRLGRRIALTPFGSEALIRARRLVSDAEALKQTGKGLHAGLIGKLRVGLSSAPGALLSSPLMLHMAEHHPRLQVEISRGNTAVLLDALREQHLDAAIVDIGLPGLDGFEVARSARAGGYAGRMVAVTGYGQAHSRRDALKAGFDAFLIKPVHAAQWRASLYPPD